MKTNLGIGLEAQNDASLVELSLAGDREAFGQIVARYQSPICALAYSACGNVSRSEDLAQEIFIAAWRKLGSLHEPGKLKAWLYGIARNLIHNSFRQQTRNPLARSESIDDAPGVTACEDHPDEHAISKEEETILWHVLSGLPQAYREPMVLFYRQNESIHDVADTLEISEEAVRQRLLRGRAMLNERVTRVIQNGLRRSGPADVFSIAVIAALPMLAATATAKGTVVGMAATHSTTGHATGFLGFLKGIGLFAGLIAIPATLGSYFGYQLGQDSTGHPQQRKSVTKFWRIVGPGLVLLLLLPLLLTLTVTGFLKGDERASFLSAMTWWLGLAYPFVLVSLIIWAWQRRRKPASASPAGADVGTEREQYTAGLPARLRLKRIVLFTTAAAAGLLVFCYLDSGHNIGRPSPGELRNIITQTAPGDLQVSITVQHYRSLFHESPETYRSFSVQVRDDGKTARYCAPVNDEALALLDQKGINCPTYVEGRDFEVLGMPGRLLPLLAAFVLAVGAIFLLKQRINAKSVALAQSNTGA